MPATIVVSIHDVVPEIPEQAATGVPLASDVPGVVDLLIVYVIVGVPPEASQLNKHVVPVEPAEVNPSGIVGGLGVVTLISAAAVTDELTEFAIVVK